MATHLLVVKRESFLLEVWRKRTLPPRRYTLRDQMHISIGKLGYETDAGVYWVIVKAKNPDWLVPDEDWAGDLRGQLIKAGDPRNPIIGAFLRVTDSGVGVHGTNDLQSLGHAASHGCIRVAEGNALKLYRAVRTGSPVVIL